MRILIAILMFVAAQAQQASEPIASDGSFFWRPAQGSIWVNLVQNKSKYQCVLMEHRKDALGEGTHIILSDKGYELWVLSHDEQNVSGTDANISVDGTLLFTLKNANHYTSSQKIYVSYGSLPTSDVTKLFNAFLQGGKVMTVDAGQAFDVPLAGANQAVMNMGACVVKGRELGGVFNY